MTSNFLIGFPDIPLNFTGSSTSTYSASYPFANSITGSRQRHAELASAESGSHIVEFSASSSSNFVALGKASIFRGAGGTSFSLRASDKSFTHPSTVSGLTLWLDFSRGVTQVDTLISQANDFSANAYHMTQATAANKPIWSRVDNRENLVTYSEQFDNAAWTKTRSSISANSLTNPTDGQATADTLVEDSTAANTHIILPATTYQIQTGFSYRISVFAKKKERHLSLRFNCTATGFTSTPYAHFDLDNGTVNSVTGSVTASITSLGNGWYRCIAECPCVANDTASPTALLASTPGTTSYNGDGTSGAYIFGFQFQPTIADDDYVQAADSPVFMGKNAWRTMHCNGSQYLSINVGSAPPANLRLTSDFSFFCAIWPDTTQGAGLTNYHMFGCENFNASGYMWRLQPTNGALNVLSTCRTNQAGAATGVNSNTNIPVRTMNIMSFIKSGSTGTHYLNGSANGSGTCNSAVSPTQTFYVGRDFGSQPFKGHLCEILIYNVALSSGDRQDIEAYLTAKWVTSSLYTKHFSDLEPLDGPSKEDVGSIFSSTNKTYFAQQYDSLSASKKPISKCYFGEAFDFGREPLRGRRIKKDLNEDKGKRQAYRLEFSWTGISNTKRQEFEEKIGKFGMESPVFILYSTFGDQLHEYSPIHCKIDSYAFTPRGGLLNDVTINFVELL